MIFQDNSSEEFIWEYTLFFDEVAYYSCEKGLYSLQVEHYLPGNNISWYLSLGKCLENCDTSEPTIIYDVLNSGKNIVSIKLAQKLVQEAYIALSTS